MFKFLADVADEVYFTTFDYPRAQSARAQYELFNRSNASYEEDFKGLTESVMGRLGEGDCLVITGSLYFISEVRKLVCA